MKVTLDKVYPVAAPASMGWKFLQDIKSVAACMPGAEITGQVDDKHFEGKIKVKIGPATAAFKGEIEVITIDDDKKEIQLVGKGVDVKGSSSAVMELTATIREINPDHCELVGHSEITVNGKMASFGGRMMDSVSERILQQFADNFSNNVIAMGEGTAAEEAAAKVAETPKELNGITIAWQLIVDFFKGLFGNSKKNSEA